MFCGGRCAIIGGLKYNGSCAGGCAFVQTERDAPPSEVLDGGLFLSPTRFAGAPSQRGPCKSLHSCDRGYHFGKEEIPAADFGGVCGRLPVDGSGLFLPGLVAVWHRHRAYRRSARAVRELHHRYVGAREGGRLLLQLRQAGGRQHAGAVCLLHEQPVQPAVSAAAHPHGAAGGRAYLFIAHRRYRGGVLLVLAAALCQGRPTVCGTGTVLCVLRILHCV